VEPESQESQQRGDLPDSATAAHGAIATDSDILPFLVFKKLCIAGICCMPAGITSLVMQLCAKMPHILFVLSIFFHFWEFASAHDIQDIFRECMNTSEKLKDSLKAAEVKSGEFEQKLKDAEANVFFFEILFFATILIVILFGWIFRTRDTTPDANAQQNKDLIKEIEDLKKVKDALESECKFKTQVLKVYDSVRFEDVNIIFCPVMRFLMSNNYYGCFYKVMYVKAWIKWTVPTMIITEFVFWNMLTFIFMVTFCVVQNVVQKQTLSLEMISTGANTSYEMMTTFWHSLYEMITPSYEMMTTSYEMMTKNCVSMWNWLKPHLFAGGIPSETQEPAA
jgi:hypothetical protein